MVMVTKAAIADNNRYGTLARVAGLADADHARGKMLRLWDQCATEQTYILTEDDVVTVLGDNAVEALVRAKLGDRVDGGVRIRGTEGRVDRFWDADAGPADDNAGPAGRSVGGANRAKTAQRGPDGRMLPANRPADSSKMESAGPAGWSSKPADSSYSSSSSSSSSSQIPDPAPPARDPGALVPDTGATPPQPSPVGLVTHARERLDAARRAIDPTAPPLPPFGGQPETDLLQRMRETPAEQRQSRLDHAIDVLVAEAEAAGSVADLRLAQLGSDRAWQRLQAMTPRDAGKSTRGRDGPGAPKRTRGAGLVGAAAARAQLAEIESRERQENST